MRSHVLIWGLIEDPPVRAVHDCLESLGGTPVLIDYAAIAQTRATFDAIEAAHRVTCDHTWRLEDFSAGYLRPHDPRDFGGGGSAFMVHQIVYDWAEQTPATVVNRPSTEATNHCKLAQALAINESGFATPPSLVTNVAAEIVEFGAEHGALIYKSLSSVRSVVHELEMCDIPTGSIGPVFVQKRIVGRNIRVHVVGGRTFASVVDTDAVDYRYAPAAIRDVDLDRQTAQRCVALTQRLGMLVSGIDLILTPDGQWYCLEVNPNPGFTAFDRSGERLVARAVAELLLAGA